MVRFRCIRSNGNARKRHETGNGNTGYPSCFRNGLTCFCHVSIYGFLQFRPVPVLFAKGRFGYTADRDIKLSPVKYFNTRLLHYSGWFATNPEYLFFAQFIIEQNEVSDSINIALKKVNGQSITASQV